MVVDPVQGVFEVHLCASGYGEGLGISSDGLCTCIVDG